jgi:hypothetical protein
MLKALLARHAVARHPSQYAYTNLEIYLNELAVRR